MASRAMYFHTERVCTRPSTIRKQKMGNASRPTERRKIYPGIPGSISTAAMWSISIDIIASVLSLKESSPWESVLSESIYFSVLSVGFVRWDNYIFLPRICQIGTNYPAKGAYIRCLMQKLSAAALICLDIPLNSL